MIGELLVRYVPLFLLGSLMTEVAGYLWHRAVSHAGLFRRVLSDLLRQRHYDHHEHKYPKPGVRHEDYASSCDLSFRVLGGVLVIGVISATLLGLIGLGTAATFLAAIASHALLAAYLHTLYHLPEKSPADGAWSQWCRSRRAIVWLTAFHDVHHQVNANYSLCLPLVDVVGRTYVSPKRLAELRREDLFPGFDPRQASSCDDPLL